MKYFFIFFIFGFAASSYGKLIFETKEIHAEVIEGQACYPFSFKFKNTGDPIEILKIETSCMCTIVNDIKRIYPKGAEDTLQGQINLNGKEGTIVVSISILTSNKQQEKIALLIFINVIKLIDITPKLHLWDKNLPYKIKQLNIKRHPTNSFKLISLLYDKKLFYVKKEEDYILVSPISSIRVDTQSILEIKAESHKLKKIKIFKIHLLIK